MAMNFAVRVSFWVPEEELEEEEEEEEAVGATEAAVCMKASATIWERREKRGEREEERGERREKRRLV
jgi:hypothetical protein